MANYKDKRLIKIWGNIEALKYKRNLKNANSHTWLKTELQILELMLKYLMISIARVEKVKFDRNFIVLKENENTVRIIDLSGGGMCVRKVLNNSEFKEHINRYMGVKIYRN